MSNYYNKYCYKKKEIKKKKEKTTLTKLTCRIFSKQIK